MEIVKYGIYKHFKGNYYLLIDVALNTEDNKEYVIYKALYKEQQLFIREKEIFLSKVDKIKYPEVEQEYRFKLINLDYNCIDKKVKKL